MHGYSRGRWESEGSKLAPADVRPRVSDFDFALPGSPQCNSKGDIVVTEEPAPVVGRLKSSDTEFGLPNELYARFPTLQRGQARLVVLHRRSGKVEHRQFSDLQEYVAGRPVYVNNSALRPGWVWLNGVGGRVRARAYFVRPMEPRTWLVYFLSQPDRSGTGFRLADGTNVDHVAPAGAKRFVLSFDREPDLEKLGCFLTPPHGKFSREYPKGWVYQALYAKIPGSMAAPTAGIHLTEELLSKLSVRELTLHTRSGFYNLPPGETLPENDPWEPEEYSIPEPPSGPVVAIGTTVVKALETWARTGNPQGTSNLFIQPPFEFRAVDALVTNLHAPRQTLMLLASAFGGHEGVMRAYREALERRYQFGFYGDLMLIL